MEKQMYIPYIKKVNSYYYFILNKLEIIAAISHAIKNVACNKKKCFPSSFANSSLYGLYILIYDYKRQHCEAICAVYNTLGISLIMLYLHNTQCGN